jgi:hypothetical protein
VFRRNIPLPYSGIFAQVVKKFCAFKRFDGSLACSMEPDPDESSPQLHTLSVHSDAVQRERRTVTSLREVLLHRFFFRIDGQLELMMIDGRNAMRYLEKAEQVLSRVHRPA